MNLGDIWLITVYDLKESVRSRRIWTIGLLFWVASVLSAWAFIGTMRLIEKGMTMVPGASSLDPLKLAQNAKFREFLKFFIGDAHKVDYLVTLPPLGLYITGIMLLSIPWIVALTATDLVAGDVQHRTIRYVLLRTARVNFVVGKVLSQTLLLSALTMTSLIPAVGLAVFQLQSFDAISTMVFLAQSTPAMLAYAFGFVGLAALASQLTSSPAKARSLGLFLFVLLWLVGWKTPTLELTSLWSIFSWLSYFSPWHAKGYLYEPELARRAIGIGLSIGFGALFTGVGFAHFLRKDV